MGIENLQAGKQVPDDVNVIIEIPSYSHPIKYEMDKHSGLINVDRFIGTAMSYPVEYGFIPHTLSEDGDPVDVLVVSPFPLTQGVVIRCRPIGMLSMTDDSGKDTKILAVPVDKLTPRYKEIKKPADLGQDLLNKIEHFFKHYKDLEPGKWVELQGWDEVDAARKEILAGVKRYEQKEQVA